MGEVCLEQDRQRLWIPTTNYAEEDSKGPPRVRIGLLYRILINTKGFILTITWVLALFLHEETGFYKDFIIDPKANQQLKHMSRI